MNKRNLQLTMSVLLCAVFVVPVSTAWAAQSNSGRVVRDEFFIVSSVNMENHQMVLKLPTEVTARMALTDNTSVVDENGKHLRVTDLRSGDTAYITYRENRNGSEAMSIRLGPMTVDALHQRYLSGTAVPVPAPPPPPPPTSNATSNGARGSANPGATNGGRGRGQGRGRGRGQGRGQGRGGSRGF